MLGVKLNNQDKEMGIAERDWRLEIGRWKLDVGRWKLEVGS